MFNISTNGLERKGIMSNSLHVLHAQVIGYLKQGKFVEGIEDFYAENATAQENGNLPTVGRTTMASNERAFAKKLTAYHGIDVLATVVNEHGGGNGIVFYEAVINWDRSDTGHETVNEVVVERWKDGKIADIRFYGNFDPGPIGN
jgi:hypothetical protein